MTSGIRKEEHLELKPETYGFTKKDYDRQIFLDGVLGLENGTLKQIVEKAGLVNVEYINMSGGVAAVHMGVKP